MCGSQAERLRRKQALFDRLDALEQDDEAPDAGMEASKAVLKGVKQRSGMHDAQRRDQVASTDASNRMPRSASDSNLVGKGRPTLPRTNTEVNGTNTGTSKLPPSLQKGHTVSGAIPSSSAIPRASCKRKRDSDINVLPEAQQTFRGLNFYFFPNNDAHPARRMRIAKALEFGATWQREFNESVTHVIVDKAMGYDLLTKFLRRDVLPDEVVLVNETYPPECIAYRILLEPRQPHFQVKGAPTPKAAPTSTGERTASTADKRAISAGPDSSLQLKPAGKAVVVREPDTPHTDDAALLHPVAPSAEQHQAAKVPASTTHAQKISALQHVQSNAALEQAISQAQELQFLPLEDEEPTSRRGSSDGPDMDTETSRPGLTLLRQRKAKFQRMQDKFQCMQKHTGENGRNPNSTTIAILQQMADYYGQVGDEWRIRAYRKAIATLRIHPTKVCTKEEALALPNVGERLAAKIEEIAFTSRLRRLDNVRAEPSDQVLQTFMKVYGAGFVHASKWVSEGYATLDQLLQKADLTENQRIGIEHYEDFNSRIPRAEVEQHGAVVRHALQRIDPAFQLIIGGSYRRCAQSSGDVDCIITRPHTGIAHIRHAVLDQLIPALTAQGFLVASLATTSHIDGTKWHGASLLPNRTIWRRIDLLLVPSDELGAAMIYFTGNDIFNRSLRLLASKLGMRLNQRGLYRACLRGRGREKLSEGELVEGRDERRIFEVLGVPWRKPEHRVV